LSSVVSPEHVATIASTSSELEVNLLLNIGDTSNRQDITVVTATTRIGFAFTPSDSTGQRAALSLGDKTDVLHMVSIATVASVAVAHVLGWCNQLVTLSSLELISTETNVADLTDAIVLTRRIAHNFIAEVSLITGTTLLDLFGNLDVKHTCFVCFHLGLDLAA